MSMFIRRDYEGFIILDKWPKKNIEQINERFPSFSFITRGKKYFFKEVKDSNVFYNELIGYELAKDFGLEAVPYDIAVNDGFNGYLSQDYMRDGYVTLEELYRVYFNYDTDDKCNLNDVSMFLRDAYPEIAENIINELITLLEFDIIIGNYDRHDQNIVIDLKNGRLAPVFDNEMLLSEEAMYGQFYGFKMSRNDNSTLDSLLSYLSGEELYNFARKVIIISQKNIESVMQRVEKKIGRPINVMTKKSIISKYSNYCGFLLRKIDKELESRHRLIKNR